MFGILFPKVSRFSVQSNKREQTLQGCCLSFRKKFPLPLLSHIKPTFLIIKNEKEAYEITLLSVYYPLTLENPISLLGNGSVNTFSRQRMHMDASFDVGSASYQKIGLFYSPSSLLLFI
jgi:hypothetical protein